MAVEMFLRLDGVTGGTKNSYHKGWSDLLSWHWGLDSARSSVAAAGTAPATFDQIVVVRKTSVDSPALMALFAQGRRIAGAEIAIVPAVTKREAQQKLVHVQLEDVVIKAMHVSCAAEDVFFSETVTLLFERVRFEYSRYADSVPGAELGAAENFTFGWDFATHAPW